MAKITTRPVKPAKAAGETPPTEEKRYGKFQLTKRERAWLPLRSETPFQRINECYDMNVRLYITCMRSLNEERQAEGDNVEDYIIRLMKDARVAVHGRHGKDDRYDIYYLLFRKVENAFRRKYHLGRIHDTFLFDREVKKLENSLGVVFNRIVDQHADTIMPASDALQAQFYKRMPKRWADYYNYNVEKSVNADNWQEWLAHIDQMPVPVDKKGAADSFWFWVAKLFGTYDRQVAATFYLKYINAVASEIDINSLSRLKATYGKFVSNEKELKALQLLIKELIQHRDLKAVLAEVPYIYNRKYTSVELDEQAIDKAATKHADTVKVLNKLLAEEEVATVKQPKKATNSQLTPIQTGLLQLFQQHKFTLTKDEVSKYAKSHKLLKNKLIESINDACQELLDDVLIEETGEGYEVLEKYYHKIILV